MGVGIAYVAAKVAKCNSVIIVEPNEKQHQIGDKLIGIFR